VLLVPDSEQALVIRVRKLLNLSVDARLSGDADSALLKSKSSALVPKSEHTSAPRSVAKLPPRSLSHQAQWTRHLRGGLTYAAPTALAHRRSSASSASRRLCFAPLRSIPREHNDRLLWSVSIPADPWQVPIKKPRVVAGLKANSQELKANSCL